MITSKEQIYDLKPTLDRLKLIDGALGTQSLEEFVAETQYEKDDVVIYDGRVYKFTSMHRGEWDIEDVEEVNVLADGTGGGGGAELFADLLDVNVGNTAGLLQWNVVTQTVSVSPMVSEFTNVSTDANGVCMPTFRGALGDTPIFMDDVLSVEGRVIAGNGIPALNAGFCKVEYAGWDYFMNPPFIGRSAIKVKCYDNNGQPLANKSGLTLKLVVHR